VASNARGENMLGWILAGLIAFGLRMVTPKSRNRYGLMRAKKETDVAARRYLLYFMLPLWIVPGFMDYLWHRRTKIETTSGTRESVLHALMMSEAGIPVTMALLFEVNSGILLLTIAAFVAHTATTWYDISYAFNRRDTYPAEQHIHSFLEVLPFANLSFLIALHWDQFAALFGLGRQRPDFSLRFKKPMLPPSYIVGLMSTIALFIGVPYAEELYRCRRAEKMGLIGDDTPHWLRERQEVDPVSV
jgi:hypothetical protein